MLESDRYTAVSSNEFSYVDLTKVNWMFIEKINTFNPSISSLGISHLIITRTNISVQVGTLTL